jgi:cysteine-rich repeat protein
MQGALPQTVSHRSQALICQHKPLPIFGCRMKLRLWLGISSIILPLAGCEPRCGDGAIDVALNEECDGGADCSPDCKLDGGTCGDGVVQSARGEECDDGNNLPGDPCNADCLNGPVEDSITLNDLVTNNGQPFLFDQALYCEGMVTRHAVVHEKDAEDNNLRWRCGDVTDIAISGNPFGQEYCEYAAITSSGQAINSAAAIDQDGFSCLITALFNDEPSLDAQLISALAQPENIGATVDVTNVRMQFDVNSRNAAIGLIGICDNMGGDNNEARQAACGQAAAEAIKEGDDARAQQLADICRGQSLLDDAVFAQAQALGAVQPIEGDPGFQKHREIRGCTATLRGGGLFFRNSDTNICGRVFRADNECGCSFNAVPQAVIGFDLAVWFTPENNDFPAECRFAQVNGQDFKQLMICDVPANEIPQIQSSAKYQNDLTGFCNDRFAKNIGLLAPLSALDAGTCSTTTEFCSEFFDN